MTHLLFILTAFLFGSIVGSFINVCIYRLPSGISIISPGSFCPNCGSPIKPYDNLPILSYILLRGKCRNCRLPISLRYPAVEIIAASVSAALAAKFSLSPIFGAFFLFTMLLLTIAFIDLENKIIPDIISLPGIIVGLLLSLLLGQTSFLSSVIGTLVGGGLLYGTALATQAILKKEGMGGGDIKLLAMIGSFLGWQKTLLTLFLAVFVGSIIGGIYILASGKGKSEPIPFGPFLSLGAILSVFAGDELINSYLTLFP